MDKIIKLSNQVALLAIGLLMYWTFIFVCITVFGFKVFRENITQGFYMSILGIFAILGGVVIINVMFNLTRISETFSLRAPRTQVAGGISRKKTVLFLISFPVIFALLFIGDMQSSLRKKNFLVGSADFLLKENRHIIGEFVNYQFSREYINRTVNSLKLLSHTDESFPEVRLIVLDEIDAKPVLLSFAAWEYHYGDDKIEKVDYIYSSSKQERLYLKDVFAGTQKDYRFSAGDGFYELYYPVRVGEKIIVLYFSSRQNYGKIGS